MAELLQKKVEKNVSERLYFRYIICYYILRNYYKRLKKLETIVLQVL